MSTTELMSPGIEAVRTTEIRAIDSAGAYAEWKSLFDRDTRANPYQHPDYVLEELKTAGKSERSPSVLVRTGTAAECAGVGILIPKSIATSKVGGLGLGWSVKGLRLAGGTFLTTDPSVETASQLLSNAVRHCTKVGADFLLIEDLDEQSALHQAVLEGSTNSYKVFAIREVQPRWYLDLPEKEEDYWKTFSGRTRYAFRTRLKKFGRTQLQRVTCEEQIPAFLAAAHEISKQSWQSRQFGLRIRNDESERKQLSILASNGQLRSYLWSVEDRPVAFAICHQHAGCFRYEEIAYLAEYSSLSPGVTALQQIVEDLFRYAPPTDVDFGGGDALYKQQFGNRQSRSQTVWLVPRTLRASSTLAYLNTCRCIRSTARTAVKSVGLATKARQWLRYGSPAAKPLPVSSDKKSDEHASDSPQKAKG